MLYCNIGSHAGVRILFALVGNQFRYSLIERRACVHCTALLFDTFTYVWYHIWYHIYDIHLHRTFQCQHCGKHFIWHFIALFIVSVGLG